MNVVNDSPRMECEAPTDVDIEWLVHAVQRHTGGPDVWLKQCVDEGIGLRALCEAIISVWEAGRGKLHQPGAQPIQEKP